MIIGIIQCIIGYILMLLFMYILARGILWFNTITKEIKN